MSKTSHKAGARWVWWVFECDRGAETTPLQGCGRTYRHRGPLLQGEHKGVRAVCPHCGLVNFTSERDGGGVDG